MGVELTIDSLAYGGKGVGRLDGKTVFVPLTAPGDEVSCSLTKERPRYAEARLEAVLAPGAGRCDPVCPVFGDCGGCQWQHLDYACQVTWKQSILTDILKRQTGQDPALMRPLVAAPEPFGYRNRVQFKIHAASGRVAVGFFRAGSHYVVDIERCPIADPRLNALIPWIRRQIAAAPRPDRIPQVDAGVGDDGRIRLVVHLAATMPDAWCRSLAEEAGQAGYALFLQQGRKQTLRRLTGEVDLGLLVDEPPLRLSYGPGGFAQVNSAQNRALVAEVLQAAGLQGDERVLDLYCGMGNFSLPLARRCRELIGLEDYAPSIAMARQNAEANGIGNARFLACPAESVGAVEDVSGPCDLALLDPPRTGAAELMAPLLALRPTTILYIACDPVTQARDLRVLLAGGYRLRYLQGFDLFPQTYHIESLAVLDDPT